ncbi:MAG: GTPase Era [Bacteroidales bacterium]|nr:GTPase Era [Bacteroidales bacterium]
MNHKAGFVNIIGNPNVGKSTLMNILVGDKLSIITSKAQTTRHRIQGIVNGDDYQIVYSDTPGILNPKYKLQEKMLKSAAGALSDADILLYVTDFKDDPEKNKSFIEKVAKVKIPILLIVNKIDLDSGEVLKEVVEKWMALLPNAEVIPTSALKKVNIDVVFEKLLELLPEGPPYYPKDQFTDKSERFFVSEIIREKIILFYKQEIPYSVEIEVESFKDEETIIRIATNIYVARDSQKGILIGHKGSSLKKVGTEARIDMEKFFGKKVFLELFVKVKKDWKDNERFLKQWGY